jgi:hypothetical protein
MNWLNAALPTAVLAVFFGYFCTPLWDMDFWWHIANGRHIAETLSLPQQDPFGMYETGGLKSGTLLQGYWLAQLAMYHVFDAWGPGGIIFLKAAVLTLCLASTYAGSRMAGAGRISALLVLCPVGMSLMDFTGERPQLFSFLYFSLTILALETHRRKGTAWPLYTLPPIMLLWANSHVGVTLGGAVLCLAAAAGAAEKYLFAGERRGEKLFYALLAIAVLCTLLTPNGLDSYTYLFARQFGEEELLTGRVSEYASPFTLWREMGRPLPFYWGFMLLALFALPKALRRPWLTPLLLTLFLGSLSLSAFRYIPFFLLYAAPRVALGLTRLAAPVKLPAAPLHGVLLAAALLVLGYGTSQKIAFRSGIRPDRFPQGAMEFMQENRLGGKMFNAFAWGGYLTWHLHPQAKMYIDGRVLDIQRFRDYTHILWATPYGLQQFERSRFDLVLIPHANSATGEQYKLNAYLLQDGRWRVAYRDQTGYLFAREDSAPPQ